LRPRKLLLTSERSKKLDRKTDQKGLTLVPLRIYFRDGIAKCEIAPGPGKRNGSPPDGEDKEAKREVARPLYKFRRR